MARTHALSLLRHICSHLPKGGGGSALDPAGVAALGGRAYAHRAYRNALGQDVHLMHDSMPFFRSLASQPFPEALQIGNDPTGVWQYESTTEQLSLARRLVREKMMKRIAGDTQQVAQRIGLSQEGAEALVELVNVSNGSQLRFIQDSIHLLSASDKYVIEGISEDLLPDKAHDALMTLLRSKVAEAGVQEWVQWSQHPDNAGIVAPPLRDLAFLNAASGQIYDDLVNALKTHIHIQRSMPVRDFWDAFVLSGEERLKQLQSGEAIPIDAARLAAKKAAMDEELESNLPFLRSGLNLLDANLADMLLSLRTGKRRWRLWTVDWYELSLLLCRLGRSGRVTRVEIRKKEMAKAEEGIARLCLRILARGKLMHAWPHCQRNAYLMGLLHDRVDDMPIEDVKHLLTKWRTVPAAFSVKLVDNILLYGRMTPPSNAPPVNRDWLIGYLAAHLMQLMAQRLPTSYRLYSNVVVQNLSQASDNDLHMLQEFVCRPRELFENHLTHALLYFIDPDALHGAVAKQYMEYAHEAWTQMGVQLNELDLEVIEELVPMLVDRFVGRVERSLSGRSPIDSTVLRDLAIAIGTCTTGDIFRIKADLPQMTDREVTLLVESLLKKACAMAGSSYEELTQLVEAQRALAIGSLQMGMETEDAQDMVSNTDIVMSQVYSVLRREEADIEDTTPLNFMPMTLLPWSRCGVMPWRRSFNEIVFRLCALLDRPPQEKLSYKEARYLLLMAEQLKALPPNYVEDLTAEVEALRKVPPPHVIEIADETGEVPEAYAAWFARRADAQRRAREAAVIPGEAADAVEPLVHKDGLNIDDFEARIIADAEALRKSLWLPVLTAVRWSFERLPRTLCMSIAHEFGELSDPEAFAKTVYSLVRISEEKYGLTLACRGLRYDELADLAHHVAASRLLHLGVFGDEVMRVDNAYLGRSVSTSLKELNDDVELAINDGRFVGNYIDLIPSAEEAIDAYLNAEDERRHAEAEGDDMVEFDLKAAEELEDDPWLRRNIESGRIGHRLTKAGPGMLLPSLIQNIADRPKEDVAVLFGLLDLMREVPTYDDVQRVMSWIQHDFLPEGIDVEAEPFEAWRLFEEKFGNADDLMPPLSEILQTPDKSMHEDAGSAAVASERWRPVEIDAHGRSYATGRRKKNAVARVWVSKGNGEVTVNGKPFAQYFTQPFHRSRVLEPLYTLWQPGEFNVRATVQGGGKSCQAQALRLGMAKALVKFDPSSHRVLKRNSLLTRDPRVVERKKPAQKKARKKRQWVKR